MNGKKQQEYYECEYNNNCDTCEEVTKCVVDIMNTSFVD